MAATHASNLATVGSKEKVVDHDLLNEERARVKKLKDAQKKLSDRLEDVEKELKDLKEKHEEDFVKDKFASLEALEKAETLEGKLLANRNKISSLKSALDEVNAKLR